MRQERLEKLLMTIDTLKVTTVKQLSRIHDLGTYRNACRVVNQLATYTNQYRGQEKVIYLNKEGRELIGSKNEVKRSPLFDHILLSNEAYIHFNFPLNWQTEALLEIEEKQNGFTFNMPGIALKSKKKQLISDAMFTRNGYVHLVEIDNTRHMQDNFKKIKTYIEMWPDIQKKFNMQPKLYFFTTTESRKRKLANALKGMNAEVWTFGEIK